MLSGSLSRDSWRSPCEAHGSRGSPARTGQSRPPDPFFRGCRAASKHIARPLVEVATPKVCRTEPALRSAPARLPQTQERCHAFSWGAAGPEEPLEPLCFSPDRGPEALRSGRHVRSSVTGAEDRTWAAAGRAGGGAGAAAGA